MDIQTSRISKTLFEKEKKVKKTTNLSNWRRIYKRRLRISVQD